MRNAVWGAFLSVERREGEKLDLTLAIWRLAC